MNWRRVLLAIAQAGALLLPHAVELGKQWWENRKNVNDEAEQEEHLAEMVSQQQEQLVVDIEQTRQLVAERCPEDKDAMRYLTLAEAFVPQGLSSPARETPVGNEDTVRVSLSAMEIFKVRLVDLNVAFRYVQMAKEIAQAAASVTSEADDLL